MEKKQANVDNKYEQQLLAYIDVPYFRNNPSYIELWRRYYYSNPNPQILLLMYHKNISTFYHWIYVELANHFLKVNEPELAHFILYEAMQNNVYDPKRLQDALSKIPIFKKRYTRGDMLCILDQKNISALGTVWNKYEERAFCDIHLDKPHLSFEMAKARQYCSELGIKMAYQENIADTVKTSAHHTDSVFFRTDFYSEFTGLNGNEQSISACEESLADTTNNEAANRSDIEKQDNKEENASTVKNSTVNDLSVGASILDESQHNAAVPTITGIRHMLEKQATLHSLPKNLAVEPEFVLDGYVHILQECGEDYFVVIRIANNVDITQTVAGKTYVLQAIGFDQALLLLNVKKYEFCMVSDALYVIYELDKLGKLSNVLQHCDGLSFIHYLAQVLSIIRMYAEKGVNIQTLDFAVNTNFEIVLTRFDLVAGDLDSAWERSKPALSQCFASFQLDLESGLDSIESAMKEKLRTFEFKRAFLQHKASVLNSL